MGDKYLIIYHKEDNDGLFSAALSFNYLFHELGKNDQDIHYYSADYNDMSKISIEDIEIWTYTYKSIIMIDISFSDIKKMKKLLDIYGNNFIWIDHHLPIIKESYKHKFDNTAGIRQTDRSALLLTYKYFYDPLDIHYNEKNVPELLRVLSAYDSWTYEKEGYEFNYVNSINKYINFTYKLNLDDISEVVYKLIYRNYKPDLKEYYNIGNLLSEYDKYNNENIVKNFGDLNWVINVNKDENNYRTACAIFIQGPSNSQMFEYYKNYVDNGIVFKRLRDGNWVISLYNTHDNDDFHCGEYLNKKYKGGGHKGAAGCTITEKQFLKICKVKRI
jgi:oligoribonuclease NrnB/cAMP/cGMP phosphodiesterase (DHH superfamily)